LSPTGPGQWATSSAPAISGVVATQLPGDFVFQLRFKDGTVQKYERIFGFSNVAALTKITDRNGNSVTLTREQISQRNKVIRITDSVARVIEFSYDNANRIAAITDPLSRVWLYSYDGFGRLVTATNPAGGISSYAYDTNGRITTMTDPRGITYLTNAYNA